MSIRASFFGLVATLLLASCGIAIAADCGSEALGTSRILAVGTEGGLRVGLKTYPETLPLADHEVVLTFDDGPLPATTGPILDVLKRECVRATFFLIGRNAEANPHLVKRELAEGHSVGHHSYSHPLITLRGLGEAAAIADIDRGLAADDRAAYGSTEHAPRTAFFRFPGFADTRPTLQWLAARNIAVFGADLWASDWDPMTASIQLQLTLGRLEKAGRGIILFHDTRAQTVAMLPAFLRELKMRGFHVVHIVAGAGRADTRAAPSGWHSETERTLTHLMPRRPGGISSDEPDASPVQNRLRPSTSNAQD